MASKRILHQKNGALDRIRTYGTLLRRQVLYPLSYEGATLDMVANKAGK